MSGSPASGARTVSLQSRWWAASGSRRAGRAGSGLCRIQRQAPSDGSRRLGSASAGRHPGPDFRSGAGGGVVGDSASRAAAGAGAGAFSGYSRDDSVLGAPLTLSQAPVFQAELPLGLSPSPSESRYWRVESKSVYDGRGWREDWQQPESLPMGEDGSMSGSPGKGGEQMITGSYGCSRAVTGRLCRCLGATRLCWMWGRRGANLLQKRPYEGYCLQVPSIPRQAKAE